MKLEDIEDMFYGQPSEKHTLEIGLAVLLAVLVDTAGGPPAHSGTTASGLSEPITLIIFGVYAIALGKSLYPPVVLFTPI